MERPGPVEKPSDVIPGPPKGLKTAAWPRVCVLLLAWPRAPLPPRGQINSQEKWPQKGSGALGPRERGEWRGGCDILETGFSGSPHTKHETSSQSPICSQIYTHMGQGVSSGDSPQSGHLKAPR